MNHGMGEIGRLNEQSAVRTTRVDDVTVTYVVDGAMAIRTDAFFPKIPASYWQDTPEAVADGGFVAMSTGGLLVERDGHRLLVDAGFGQLTETTPIGRYDCGALPESLALLGLTPADIDVVALTHVHVDHTGWTFVDGKPGFPSAAYRVAADEWTPLAAGVRSLGSPDDTSTITPLGAVCSTFHDGDEIAPGVVALVTPGHSTGHTSYLVTTARGRRILAFGDAFHIPVQLTRPEWASAADVDPARVGPARARLLAELEQPDTIGFGIHFGDQAFGRVVRDADHRPVWQPIPTSVVGPPPR